MREDVRKLHYFAGVLQGLKEQGQIGTTDPRNMQQSDIEGFITWMKTEQLQTTTRVKYLQILDRHLLLWGNDTIQHMKQDRTLGLPRERDSTAPIVALSVWQLQQIIDATYHMAGWRGMCIRGVIALGFGTGCRPKEIVGAEIADLDLDGAQFYVRHPKGEGSWGQSQWIPIIRGDMIPLLQELLAARKQLQQDGPLFINEATGAAYSLNGIRVLKAATEQISGITWALKDLRSTLCSLSLEGDVSRMKAVSLQLRHASIRNTEHFYARINVTREIRTSLGNVWKEKPVKKP